MKVCAFVILLSFFSLSTFSKTITLSRGEDAVLQKFSELILQKAYQKIGIELKIIHVPIARSLVLANNGIVDGDVSRISKIENQYGNLIKIPVPINHIDIRMFSYNKKLLANKNNINGFYRMGCVRGLILVEKISTTMKADCYKVNGHKQGINMLNKNRIDVLLLPLTIGAYFKSVDSQFSTSHYSDSLGREPLFHYLHKKHHKLVPKLTLILQQMNIDIYEKTYRDSLKETISPDGNSSVLIN